MYNIAIIDDNKDFCFVMECFLRNYFGVSTFIEITSFLEKLKSEKYDLVLVDFTIPIYKVENIENGCDLINFLKNNLKNPPIVVLLSGWINKNDMSYGKQMCPQADGYLAKDSGLTDILKKLNDLLLTPVLEQESAVD